MFQLQRLLPQARCHGAHGQGALLQPPSCLAGCLLKILKPVDPCLLLGRPCLRSAPDPGKLGAHQILSLMLAPCLLLQPLRLLLQIGLIIALIGIQVSPVQLRDPRGDPVQKIPVVGDQEQLPLELQKPVLQPQDHVLVQMVGGLIQDQQFRFGQQGLRQGNSLALAAGQRSHQGIMICHPQAVQHGARLGLLLGSASPPRHDRAKDRLILRVLRVLRQIRDGDIPPADHLPLIALHDAGHDLQKRGLAGSVYSDQTDPLSGINPQRDVMEQILRPVCFSNMFQIQTIHILRLRGTTIAKKADSTLPDAVCRDVSSTAAPAPRTI